MDYLKKNIIFRIFIILLSLLILILSIVGIFYFSKANINKGQDINLGTFINVKQNHGAIKFIEFTTYLFFGMSIIASVLCIASSFPKKR